MRKTTLQIFCLDFLVILLAYGLSRFSTNINILNTLSILIVFFPLLWLMTYDKKSSFFVGDSYAHVIKTTFYCLLWVGLAFALLRLPYSFKILFITLSSWCLIGLGIRWYLRLFASPLRCLVKNTPLAELADLHYLQFLNIEDPATINIKEIDCIIMQPAVNYDDTWRRFLLHAQVLGLPIFSEQELDEMLLKRIDVRSLDQTWIPTSFSLNHLYVYLKHLVDALVILLLSPLLIIIFAIVSIAIRLNMGAPVIYRQKRLGRDNKIFTVYKFRTMTKGQAKEGDESRLTTLGKFLRTYRLDELPQLWNVLKGEMSLIGPRPEWEETAKVFTEKIPLYNIRHLVRPGITGWAQVNQGHVIGIDGNYNKLRYDIYYVKHFSVWLDLKIVARTLLVILTGKGAK
jgi:lipopolysaccharide/colanic/teichoic acid biosynthesis glycosyltransferase